MKLQTITTIKPVHKIVSVSTEQIKKLIAKYEWDANRIDVDYVTDLRYTDEHNVEATVHTHYSHFISEYDVLILTLFKL